MKKHSIRISGKMYDSIKSHLFPGDNKEAIVIALCGRCSREEGEILLIHKLIEIPHDKCFIRETDLVQWPTEIIVPYLEEAIKRGWAVVKIHSHPNGYPKFSSTDDKSDIDLFDSIYGWFDSDMPHGSMIMLPDGSMFGRIVTPDLSFITFDRVSIIGDDLRFWDSNDNFIEEERGFAKRTAQTFGSGTTQLLKRLKVGVVGCSGTGSPTIEQLVRLGVGTIVMVDPDVIEEKNLNRILNTTKEDAKRRASKVEVLKSTYDRVGLGTKIIAFNENIYDNQNIINCLMQCDVLFGCVDSVDGRHLLNQISSFYLIPYFDLGVKIIADGKGGIEQLCATVHYLQPGGSSLRTRGVYSSEDLRAASMYRANIDEYKDQRKSGYIVNVNEDSPAVISINMQISSAAVNEFLARIHPYRYDSNDEFSIIRISFSDGYYQHERDTEQDSYLNRYVGRGDILPMLNMPELG